MKKISIFLMLTLFVISLGIINNCAPAQPEEPQSISGWGGVVTASASHADQMTSLRAAQAECVKRGVITLIGENVWAENEIALSQLFLGEESSGWQETNAYIAEERMSNTSELEEGGFSGSRTVLIDVVKLEQALQEAGFTILVQGQ